MVNKPEALPWHLIRAEVEQATMRVGRGRLISARIIAEHIEKFPRDYPEIMKPSEWHPMEHPTFRSIVNRVNRAIADLKWKCWNNGRQKGKYYIVPWVQEDPIIVKARAES